KVIWLGSKPKIEYYSKNKKGQIFDNAKLTFHSKNDFLEIELDKKIGKWLVWFLDELKQNPKGVLSYGQMKKSFEEQTTEDFEPFIFSKQGVQLRNFGLLIV